MDERLTRFRQIIRHDRDVFAQRHGLLNQGILAHRLMRQILGRFDRVQAGQPLGHAGHAILWLPAPTGGEAIDQTVPLGRDQFGGEVRAFQRPQNLPFRVGVVREQRRVGFGPIKLHHPVAHLPERVGVAARQGLPADERFDRALLFPEIDEVSVRE